MNSQLSIALAVKLCAADMSCGFISIAPVLGNRDELIQQRLVYYREWLQATEDRLMQDSCFQAGSVPFLLRLAVELTSADILSDAIAVAPVLYDRDEKIAERLLGYFSYLHASALECGLLGEEEEEKPQSEPECPPRDSATSSNAPAPGMKKKKKRR